MRRLRSVVQATRKIKREWSNKNSPGPVGVLGAELNAYGTCSRRVR